MALTREGAIALYDSKEWESWTDRERATTQLQEERLFMPFYVFAASVSKVCGRGVFAHEFANPDALLAEIYGEEKAPTFDEIVDNLAKRVGANRVVVVVTDSPSAAAGLGSEGGATGASD